MPTINARPFEYSFDNVEQLALLVIDMQKCFLDPGGFASSLGNNVNNIGPVVKYTKELIDGCRGHHIPIIYTREAQLPNLADCPVSKRNRGNASLRIGDRGKGGRVLIAGEPATDIVPEVYPEPGDTVINKPGKDAFWGTDLAGILFNLKATHLFICGVTTEVCVQTTMREANDRGYVCLLAEDATGSYYPDFKYWTLEMIVSQGAIVGWTATTAEVLTGLNSAAPGGDPVGSTVLPPYC
jgi:nicotinamidase-related amidase